jgi:hypothetical protein
MEPIHSKNFSLKTESIPMQEIIEQIQGIAALWQALIALGRAPIMQLRISTASSSGNMSPQFPIAGFVLIFSKHLYGKINVLSDVDT